MSAQSHNTLAPALLKQLVDGSDTPSAAMVVLESLVLGVMLYYHPDPRHADAFLYTMTNRVLARIAEHKNKAGG